MKRELMNLEQISNPEISIVSIVSYVLGMVEGTELMLMRYSE